MRKGLIILLCAALALTFALPAAAADIKASGFYRSKAYVSNFIDGYSKPSLRTGLPGDEEQTNAFVEQRFRVKFSFGTENVQAVWHIESDMIWGDVAGSNKINTADAGVGANRNTGGALGADRINTETKDIYVWFKVPDTSMDFTVGLQNQSDVYAGTLYNVADMAGIFMTGKYEPVKYKLGWAKLYENDTKKTDDQTLYVLETAFVPTKDVRLGLNFYFFQDDTQKTTVVNFTSTSSGGELPFPGTGGGANPLGALNSKKVYTPGINVAFKAGPATLSGFAVYQFGKIDYLAPANKDIDVNAFMLDARADLNVGPGKAFLEGLYMSGGDQPRDEYKSIISLETNEGSPGGNGGYGRTNMYQILYSPDTINVAQCIVGCSGGEMGSDLGMGGRGLWHVAAGYNQNLTKQLKGAVNVGYVAATTRLKDAGGVLEDRAGTGMGTEVNARLDYNLYKGLDVGLVGSYVFLGDFFKEGGQKPKDPYTGYARVNYAF
ncbi:MAG: hypothetical protein ACYC37_09525 [Desulfobacteria bacterium]